MNNQLTTLDWLSYSVRLILTPEEVATEPVMACPQGLTLTEYPGTNMFKRRAILYDHNGDKILTLLWHPHSSIIDSHLMLVEVANPLLYDGRYRHLPDLLQAIHSNTWVSLSRLDMATDFQPTLSQSQVIDMIQHGSAYAQGKQEGTMWHHYDIAAKYVTRTPHQITWGHKTSAIKWKLYNKTKEIFETMGGRTWCNKPYIADYWQRNGFDPRLDTWRLEVSIMGSGQHQWHGHRLAWDTVANLESYTALFYDLYATRMKIRLNEGHTNKRYDHEVVFLDIPDGHETSRISRADAGTERTRVTFASTIRTLVKELDRPEIAASPYVHEPLLVALEQTVRRSQLGGYFSAMTGKPLEEWIDLYKNRDGDTPSLQTKVQNERKP